MRGGSTFLYWHTIWRHIRELTGMEVEKRAVIKLVDFYEYEIDKVIHQSILELDKLNEFRDIQGLNSKKRIDANCILNAIKIINTDKHVIPSYETGGAIEKKEKSNKHLPKENFLTEVQ